MSRHKKIADFLIHSLGGAGVGFKILDYLSISKGFIFLLSLLICITACTKKPDPKQQVLALQKMSDLATTECVVTKIVRANDDQTWYKIGDRKILISCEATVKTGIDLSSLQANDVIINDKKITLYLPPVKVISVNIPAEKIKVEYKEVSLMRSDFTTAERDQLMTQGEMQIRNSIPELGIMETSQKNTIAFLTIFLQQLGYEEINIRFGEQSPLNTPSNG